MKRGRRLASGDLCRESAPLGQGSRALLLVDLPRDEMALLTELVGKAEIRKLRVTRNSGTSGEANAGVTIWRTSNIQSLRRSLSGSMC